jgi:hypothetical protein
VFAGQTFPLAEEAAAHHPVMTAHTTGKIALPWRARPTIR